MTVVEVITGARAHFTLIDMNGQTSRRVDGGVGLMLEEPRIRIRVRLARYPSIRWCTNVQLSPDDRRELDSSVSTIMSSIKDIFGLSPTALDILECPPVHSGFGAKTQLLLSTAAAAFACHGLEIEDLALARAIRRGGTSGIGVHGFLHGGLIVDGGHTIEDKTAAESHAYRPSSFSERAGVPPLIARYDFPTWPVLIVRPLGRRIHGKREAELFTEVCPVPISEVQALCHVILMKMLPAVLERNLVAFGESLWEIQERRWKAFEIEAQAPSIRRLLTRMREELDLDGAAMSSWGTAIICIDERLLAENSAAFIDTVRQLVVDEAGDGGVFLTRGRNSPAEIQRIIG